MTTTAGGDHWQPGLGDALVVFDADDTLWSTEPLYDEARQRCRDMVEAAGIDGAAWEAAERTIDIRNVAAMGLSRDRFPTSCVAAYRACGGSDDTFSTRIWEAAASVFTRKAPVTKGVPEVLINLQERYRLVLLTQGDDQVQKKRIADSGLSTVFDAIHVVEYKTVSAFQSVLVADGRPASQAWSIGNSLPSDINPALKLGMMAIWLDTHVWEHERREAEPRSGEMFSVPTLWDVPEVLNSHT